MDGVGRECLETPMSDIGTDDQATSPRRRRRRRGTKHKARSATSSPLPGGTELQASTSSNGGGKSAAPTPDSGVYKGDRPRLFCGYCWRAGHDRSKCRRRLKLCFRCGAADHHTSVCSRPRTPSGGHKFVNGLEEQLLSTNPPEQPFAAFSLMLAEFSRVMQRLMVQASNPMWHS